MSKRKFSGFDLWKECLAGNLQAWREMEKYNKADVLALEQVYNKLAPWGTPVNFNLYTHSLVNVCKCGSTSFVKRGFAYTESAKYQIYRCKNCGACSRGRTNELSKAKRTVLKSGG